MTYLPRNHPVRLLLEQAATGQQPTRAQLDQLGGYSNLPDGHSVSRFRSDLTREARGIAATAATGAYGDARGLAETAWRSLAERMTPEEAQLDDQPEAGLETLDTISSRMFGRR